MNKKGMASVFAAIPFFSAFWVASKERKPRLFETAQFPQEKPQEVILCENYFLT